MPRPSEFLEGLLLFIRPDPDSHGPMLDRMAAPVVSYSVLLGAFGAFLFGMGGSLTTVLIGRVLIGVGMARFLWGHEGLCPIFSPEKFATLLEPCWD